MNGLTSTIVVSALLSFASGLGCGGSPVSLDSAVCAIDHQHCSTAHSIADPRPDEPDGVAWIDVHMHMSTEVEAPFGSTAAWRAAVASQGPAHGVLLSLEHFAVGARNDALPEAGVWYVESLNEFYAVVANAEPTLDFFASLECWHDTRFSEPGWVEACKADVDRWLEAGAVGFKDHIGKQYDHMGDTDSNRWLGAWNRYNGFCTTAPEDQEPNRQCMLQNTVRYPAMEDKWREVVRYITEVRGAPILTHASSAGGDERCFDPLMRATNRCSVLTQGQLLEFGRWARDKLSPEARRRIVVAHLGFLFLGSFELTDLLDTGVSVDTAISASTILGAGCAARSLLGQYPDQILFGTDNNVNSGCLADHYAACRFAFVGPVGETRRMPTCQGEIAVTGMELAKAVTSQCEHEVPPETLANLVRENYQRIRYSAPRPGVDPSS